LAEVQSRYFFVVVNPALPPPRLRAHHLLKLTLRHFRCAQLTRHLTNRLGVTQGLSWCTVSPSVPFPAATFLLPFIDTLLFLCCRLPVAWCPPESQRYLMQHLTRQARMHVNFYAAFFPMPAQKLTCKVNVHSQAVANKVAAR